MKNIVLITMSFLYSSHILGADTERDWRLYNTTQTDTALRIFEWKKNRTSDTTVDITINEESPHPIRITLDSRFSTKNTAKYEEITLALKNCNNSNDLVLEAFSSNSILLKNFSCQITKDTTNGIPVFYLIIGEK